nr:response regulator [Rhizobium sp. SSA_523]
MIVEDAYFLADDTGRALKRAGVVIIGPVATASDALEKLATERVDAAILDLHLRDETVFLVADRLVQRKIPFLFATSVSASALPKNYTGFALCEKPKELNVIARELFGSGNAKLN